MTGSAVASQLYQASFGQRRVPAHRAGKRGGQPLGSTANPPAPRTAHYVPFGASARKLWVTVQGARYGQSSTVRPIAGRGVATRALAPALA